MSVRANNRDRSRTGGPGGGCKPFGGGNAPLKPNTYSTSDYMFAMPGIRQANKNNSPSTGTATKAAVSLSRVSPSYPIQNLRFFMPNYWVQEANTVQEVLSNLYTIEAFAVIVGGTLYTTTTTMPANVDPAVSNGGLMITIPTGVIPANSTINVRIALAFTAGTAIPTYARLRSGEVTRMHDTNSFASAVNSTGSIAITGSVSSNWSGFLPCPVYVTAQQPTLDGRPVVLCLGDSINYGKGQYDNIEPASVTGIVPIGMNANTNSKQWIVGDMSIAGSGPDSNPQTMQYRTALIAQNGNRPFNMITSEHFNNQDYTVFANTVTTMQNYIGMVRGYWPGVPIAQTTPPPKCTSTDGFRTLANQSVNVADSSTGTRWQFHDYLLSTRMSGKVDYVVDVASGLSYDINSATNRDKIKVSPNTYSLTQNVAANATTWFLNGNPALDSALCIDPNSGSGATLIVIASVATANAGEYQVTMSVGSSTYSFAAKTAGTLVGESYFADGVPSTTGLHPSARADDMVTPVWDTFKNQFGAAVKTAVASGNGSAFTWGDTTPVTWSS